MSSFFSVLWQSPGSQLPGTFSLDTRTAIDVPVLFFIVRLAAKKALATLDREWDGLIAHRDFPVIGLDNNPAERQIRGPVVTRKNAGGSRNGDSARLAAVIWTVTATMQMAGLNLLTWLTAYLDECGRNGGKSPRGPDLERFLPWNASPEDLHAWA